MIRKMNEEIMMNKWKMLCQEIIVNREWYQQIRIRSKSIEHNTGYKHRKQ